MDFIDISKNIFEADVYPGDPVPVAEKISRMELGDECNLTAMYACFAAKAGRLSVSFDTL